MWGTTTWGGGTFVESVITHYDTFILRLQSAVGSPRGSAAPAGAFALQRGFYDTSLLSGNTLPVFPATMCDDRDDIFDTAAAPSNIVATVAYRRVQPSAVILVRLIRLPWCRGLLA